MSKSCNPNVSVEWKRLRGEVKFQIGERGADQKRMASETGLTESALSRVLSGRSGLSANAFVTVCAWLDTDPRDWTDQGVQWTARRRTIIETDERGQPRTL